MFCIQMNIKISHVKGLSSTQIYLIKTEIGSEPTRKKLKRYRPIQTYVQFVDET